MLHEWLQKELSLYTHGAIIVWYDEGGTLTPLVREDLLPERKLLLFDGSYLALRLRLEKEDPEFEQKWLVYVPDVAPTPSWLRDWELMGCRVELDLLDLLCKQTGLAPDAELRQLLKGDNPTAARSLVENWASLLGSRPVTKQTIAEALVALTLHLPCFDVADVVLRILADPQAELDLGQAGLLSHVETLIAQKLGVAQPVTTQLSMRQQLAIVLLLSELVTLSGQGRELMAEFVPDQDRWQSLSRLTPKWREKAADSYLELAAWAETELDLGHILVPTEQLLSVGTYPIVDRLFLLQAQELAGSYGPDWEKNWRTLENMADKRRRLFGTQQSKTPKWEAIYLGGKLLSRAAEAHRCLDAMDNLTDLAVAYTAPDGWWQMDDWIMQIATLSDGFSPEEQQLFIVPALRAYNDYVHKTALKLTKLAGEQGWRPNQNCFWRDFVRPRSGVTVVFLIDALRFDLAQRLVQFLVDDGSFTADINWRWATLPSYTDLGMAALLPKAETGLGAILTSDGLKVRIKYQDVTGRKARREYLNRALGEKCQVMDLEEAARLAKLPSGQLVILWDAIDYLGDAGKLTPVWFLDLVKRLQSVIENLHQLGCVRTVITSDHGFLFLPAGAPGPSRLTAPARTRQVVVKHRFAAGSLAKPSESWEVAATDIGLRGDISFAFPEGLSVFGLPGATPAFLHGGVSLQEAVVPIVTTAPMGE